MFPDGIVGNRNAQSSLLGCEEKALDLSVNVELIPAAIADEH